MSVGSLPPVFSHFGGAIQRRVAELAREQVKRGHSVTVFSPAEKSASGEIDGVDVRYVRCRLPSPSAHIEFQSLVAAHLVRLRHRPDVLHFHSEPEGAVISAMIRVPKVLSYDNFYFRRGRRSPLFRVYRRALRAFDLLLPCSEYCARTSRAYWSLPVEKIRVVYNGVNLEQFSPDPAIDDALVDIGGAGKTLLYVGRICHQKGSDTLLDAYDRMREADDAPRLVMAGPIGEFDPRSNGNSAGMWRQRIQAVGATYIGQVEDARLASLFSMADVFVMPTRELEMFGMAAVEAEACGTPVVASDHGGLPETVPDGCGLRFPPGDVDALHNAIMRLLLHDDQRASLAARANEHVKRFAWSRIATRLDEVYEEATRAHA